MTLSYDEVIEGNVQLHREEAKFYDRIHHEIWNKQEQKRLLDTLRFVTSQIDENEFRAVDFGAGTGNITEKLLKLGFKVVAIDISKEMCDVLRAKNKKDFSQGRLQILNLNIDKTNVTGRYDLVTCYSVLHHLPNYIRTIQKLSRLVRLSGILYVDHEPPLVETKRKGIRNPLKRIIMAAYYFVNKLLNTLYLYGIDTPRLDYSQADVYDTVDNTVDYRRIRETLKKEGFQVIRFGSYYSQVTWFKTPLNFLHKMVTGANTTMIIAKKVKPVSYPISPVLERGKVTME